MKKLSFLSLAAAGLLLAACSSSEDVAVSQSDEEARSEGYVAVDIALPQAPVAITRAANDNYDDGLASEYYVQDCALIFFQGTSGEADAKLMTAQKVLIPFTPDHTDADNDNISYTFTATSKVSGYDKTTTGNKLYALALVNYTNVLSLADDGTPTVGGTALAKGTATFKDLVELTTDKNLIDNGSGKNKYFFMTNAVLSKVKGGWAASPAPTKSDLTQLAELNPNKIKETEAEARADVAGEIFVERAVAKVTLSVSSSATTVDPGVGTPLTISSVDGWAIDNMEPASFVTKNTGFLGDTPVTDYIGYTSGAFSSNNFRMVGNVSVRTDKTPETNPYLETSPDLYRSYWCIDPQYSAPATGMKGATAYVSRTTPLYCYENTFNVENQIYKNTTRAIIKITTDGGTFYTVNEDQTRYNAAGAESYAIANVVNNTAVLQAFTDNLNAGKSYDVDKNSFKTTFERDDNTGRYKLTKLELAQGVKDACSSTGTFKESFKTDDGVQAILDAAAEAANTAIILREYKNGEMWYEARIQHFADPTSPGYTATSFGQTDTDLAPWNKWETTDKPSSGNVDFSYPGTNSEKNYLGRYGMVRNNWYDIEVTGFKKLGKPVDPSGKINNPDVDYPDTPDTPDDNITEYISARIHVLSWAKRTQKWTF